MRVKKWGIALLASMLFSFTNPAIPAQKALVHASEDQKDISKILKEKKAKTLQDLETILKEEYNLEVYKYNEDGFYYQPLSENTIDLERFYDLEGCDLSSVVRVLQDEEFKQFYRYASKEFPCSWHKNLFRVVETYKALGGFEGIRGWLQDLKIIETENKEIEHCALLALASAKEWRDGASVSVYKFPWDVFKKHPKTLAEISAMSKFVFDYRYTPRELIDDYSQELVEIAKNCDMYGVGYTFDSIPKDKMKEHSKRIVEIARQAKQQTRMIYDFISITGIVPDDRFIAEMVKHEGREIVNRKELAYNDIKRVHLNLKDERLIRAIEYFDKNERMDSEQYVYELRNALTLEYAKDKGLKGESVHQLKEFLKKGGYSLLGTRPKLSNYKKILAANREVAEALIEAYKDEQIPEDTKAGVVYTINHCTRSLADIVNLLHDRTAEREEVVSSLSPGISFFAIAQGDEVFTSSFNLFYDNLAYKLGGGQGVLPQENRTEAQERTLSAGKEKVLDFIQQTGQEESELSKFVFRTSYFGRLQEIIPKDKQKQEEFLRKLVSYTKKDRDAFYLAPTFESILSTEEEYKATLENLLIDSYEKEENLVSGIIIYAHQSKISETNKQRAERIIAELEKEYGVNIEDLELPREWFAKKEGEDMLTLRFKLYFHPETKNDNILKPTHMRIMIDQFVKGGYAQKTNKNSEVILTKIKNNSRGEKVKLEFILSNRKNLKMKEDIQSKKIIMIGHRGHSYDVDATFGLGYDTCRKLDISFMKLVYIGSCGGFSSIPYLNNKFEGKAQFIATKNVGLGLVNNIILYELAETLAEKPKMWKETYKTVRNKVEEKYQETNPEVIEVFKNYSFPGDLPSLVLKYSKTRRLPASP